MRVCTRARAECVSTCVCECSYPSSSLRPSLPPSRLCEAAYWYASLALWLLAQIPCLSIACSFILPFYFFLIFFFYDCLFACPPRFFSPALLSCSSSPSPTSLPLRVPSSPFHLGLRELRLTVYFLTRGSVVWSSLASCNSHPLALFTLLSA